VKRLKYHALEREKKYDLALKALQVKYSGQIETLCQKLQDVSFGFLSTPNSSI